MPRLQVSRRAPLLSTNLRSTFLEAFSRSVLSQGGIDAKTLSLNSQVEPDAARTLSSIARRVQTDMKRVTGRFVPIAQVMISIHALKHIIDRSLVDYISNLSSPPTPKGIQIFITPTSPSPIFDRNSNASMSRRRLARNIPTLQRRLSIPTPAFSSLLAPAYGSPTSPFDGRPLFSMSRRSSLSSDDSGRYPVTPIEQIVHTPLSPPKIPRAPPRAPRTWGRLNAQMPDEVSPLGSPAEPSTPYILSPKQTRKPVLNPLCIPVSRTFAVGEAEPRPNHLFPGSPRSASPFEPVRSPLAEGMSASAIPRRPTPVRNNSASTSSLTRTALLRASRPHLARSLSVCETLHHNVGANRAPSPLSPISPRGLSSPTALASPFIIRSQELDTDYFRF
ncbi:hypothetical protein C8Q78DRAFT_984945 [Trametes maxima]|nr:hypothetical protein C8Q78DRAFT_984945 [Trametes maxima]